MRFLARHQWAYDLKKKDGGGLVTAYVMTKTIENNRILMYKGRLKEFYLNIEGQFAYVILTNCYRFYMTIQDDMPIDRPTNGVV